MDRDDPITLLLERAEVSVRQNRDHEARHLFRSVLRRDPTNASALLWLVYMAEDGQAGLNYVARLLDAHPHHPQARTAVRWARRRIPTSVTPVVSPPRRRLQSDVYRLRRLAYALIAGLVLVGLGLFWQFSQAPTASVQAGAVISQGSGVLASTDEAESEALQVSIPLFTPTPTDTPSPTPTPVPTGTPGSAWVPVLGQPQTFNMSCESRSAADLAAFWGVSATELEILTALGESDNPHEGFVGDVGAPPGSLPPYGYGVYVEPLASALRGFGLDARAAYELGLDGLRAELLAGRPVLVWGTYGMRFYDPLEWTSSDGRSSTVVPFMHTFLVTGYDETGFTFVDAYDATIQNYAAEEFVQVWNLFDQMALVVKGIRQ
jgi:uncharacterized protein YvpB